ncbi:hypothetical protein ACWNT8_06795 [Pigmentibacter ruber]
MNSVEEKNELVTFEELEKQNRNNFNHFDYISYYSNQKKITSDLFISFYNLFWPQFIIYENMIFLEEKFSFDYFKDLKNSGNKPFEIEVWMNLINLDSFFSNAKYSDEFFPQMTYLSNEIVKLWKIKLSIDYPEKIFDVKSEIDKDTDEIFILHCQKE